MLIYLEQIYYKMEFQLYIDRLTWIINRCLDI